MILLDIFKAERKFRDLVGGKTTADELLKRIEKAEAQTLNADGILRKVNEKVKNKYTEISKNAEYLTGAKGIVYLLSTRPHTSSNSNFVKLVKNSVVNNQTLKNYLINPSADGQSAKSNVTSTRARLMRYLKLTDNEGDDANAAALESNEDLKVPFTRDKNKDIGEKMRSHRRVNRLKVVTTALLVNLIDWASAVAGKIGAEDKTKSIAPQKPLGNNENDPGIFKNLPNDDNYCYLNTALQNLYYSKAFSDKVLGLEYIPENDENYKELRATQFFFKYLKGRINESEFKSGRVAMARALGYGKVVHAEDSVQKNSYTAQVNIERCCREQMRALSGKESRDKSNIRTDLRAGTPVLSDYNQGQFITLVQSVAEKLYSEGSLRDRVLGIDNEQLGAGCSPDFVYMRSYFTAKRDGRLDDRKRGELISALLAGKDKYDENYEQTARRNLEKDLNKFERQKRAYLLTQDAKISIPRPIGSVLHSLSSQLPKGKCCYLPLKKEQFVVELADRNHRGSPPRQGFLVEDKLDLSSLVDDKRLKVFIKNTEQAASKCKKFKLVSATVGTGGHYYLYRLVGSNWMKFNDLEERVKKCDWQTVQKEAGEMGELLTYELSN